MHPATLPAVSQSKAPMALQQPCSVKKIQNLASSLFCQIPEATPEFSACTLGPNRSEPRTRNGKSNECTDSTSSRPQPKDPALPPNQLLQRLQTPSLLSIVDFVLYSRQWHKLSTLNGKPYCMIACVAIHRYICTVL